MEEDQRTKLLGIFMDCADKVQRCGPVIAVQVLATSDLLEGMYFREVGGKLPEGVSDWRLDRDALVEAGNQVHTCLKAVNPLVWSEFFRAVCAIPGGEEAARLQKAFQDASDAILMFEGPVTFFYRHTLRCEGHRCSDQITPAA